jgi:O-antigen/teichoic acid export membrane protein
MVLSISIGAKLLFANIAGSLILGIGRQIIDSVWGITAFGRFSFSLSLTNFFLQFIGQVSMVLFPALRQTDKSKRNEIYSSLRDALGILLPIVFVAYYPMQLIFGIWLPDYKESLSYIAVLLPLCTYDGKMQMLCNTYFKVLRKENFLLFINAGAALISFIICSFSAHVLGSITAVVYSMVLSVALRSIISELYLARMLNKKVGSSIILESSLVLGFIISINVFGNGLGTIIFLGMYGVFLMANKGKIMNLIMLLKRK